MNLQFNLTYSITPPSEIRNHFFSLRMIPGSSPYQECNHLQWSVENCSNPARTIDGFQNEILYGRTDEPSETFKFNMQGQICIASAYGEEKDEQDFSGLYIVPSEMIEWSDSFLDFIGENDIFSISDKAEYTYTCNKFVHQYLKHQDGLSLGTSSIDQLLEKKTAYSQDAVHLLLAMLRFREVPARFIAGLNFENSELLYWAEVLLDGKWVGLDPVHNRKIRKEPYIKLTHGRDFKDCRIHNGFASEEISNAVIKIDLQHQLQS